MIRNSAEEPRRHGCLALFAFLLTVVPLLGLLWAIFNVEWVRSSACTEPRLVSASERIDYCRGYEPVTAAEAEMVFDDFLDAAAGAEPDRAWIMLSGSERGEVTEEKFTDEWAPALWAERIGPARETAERNRYGMSYRIYPGPGNEAAGGDVPYYKRDVEVINTGSKYEIADLMPEVRDDNFQFDYAWLELATETETFREPDSTSQHVETFRSGQGRGLRSLCQAQVGEEWWSRTPLGWMQHGDATLGNEPIRSDRAYLCEGHHAEEVLLRRQAGGGGVVGPPDG